MNHARARRDDAKSFARGNAWDLVRYGPHLDLGAGFLFDVTFVCRHYAIERHSVRRATHEREIFRVGPAKRHGRAGRCAGFETRPR